MPIYSNRIRKQGVAQYRSAKSIDLDGVDEYLQAQDPGPFKFGPGGADLPFSLSVWVKMDDPSVFRMFSKGALISRDYRFSTDANDKLTAFLYGKADGTIRISKISTAAVTGDTNAWAFYVMTYDGSAASTGITMYRNGTAVAANANDAGVYVSMTSNLKPLEIGRLEGNVYADGTFTDAAVWGKELSSTEVTEIYNSGKTKNLLVSTVADDLISWWKMGDDSRDSTEPAGLVYDQKGNNHLIPFNMVDDNIVTDAP
jgi:hypothetical protein